MSSGSPLSLNTTAEAFAAAWANELAQKRNKTTTPASATDTRATAQWGNLVDDFMLGAQAKLRFDYSGTGSPEGVVAAPVGALYRRTNGGAGTTLYVKESGTGTTGWVALGGLGDGTIYEVNFASLPDVTLTDGGHDIDDLTWTMVGSAELGGAFIEGAGIEFEATANNGGAVDFTSLSRTAPHLWLPLEDIPGFDPNFDHIFEIYCSTLTHEASGEGVFMAIWGTAAEPNGSSAERVRLAGLYNGGSGRRLRATSQATIVTSDAAIATHNVLSMRVGAAGIGQVGSGVWASGWPTTQAGLLLPTVAGANDPMFSPGARLVLGLSCANDASPTTEMTIERLRVRRVG